MCLIVNKNFKTKTEAKKYKHLIAKEDIKVYKILEACGNDRTKGYAPYYNFLYEKGFQYTEDKFEIDYNLNSNNEYFITVEQGLHALATNKKKYIRMFLECRLNGMCVEMIIPKGSKYYLGTNNDIVTDNLIWY